MSAHRATVRWSRTGPDFLRGHYSRAHTWTFDGGATVPASPSPRIVPTPWSDPSCVDPEEALVAAAAACHMLTFLHLAARSGYVVERYEDEAEGTLSRTAERRSWVSRIVLRPRIEWGGDHKPAPADIDRLHQEAHAGCFIANSIRSEIVVTAP